MGLDLTYAVHVYYSHIIDITVRLIGVENQSNEIH
jgi:hypothetical protein